MSQSSSSGFNTIEDAVEALRAGRMVIVVDADAYHALVRDVAALIPEWEWNR